MRLSARILVGVVVSGALMSARLPPLRAQTLADVARQEEERRKELKSQTKVYTNKDLRGQVVGPPPPPPDQAGSTDSSKEAASDSSTDTAKDGAKDGAKDAAQAESSPKGESYWRERIKSLQTALDRDEMHLAALQSRINALTTEFVNRDDPAQRSQIEGDRKKSLAELERMKKQVEDDKKALAAAQSEGRRAGAQADWLR